MIHSRVASFLICNSPFDISNLKENEIIAAFSMLFIGIVQLFLRVLLQSFTHELAFGGMFILVFLMTIIQKKFKLKWSIVIISLNILALVAKLILGTQIVSIEFKLDIILLILFLIGILILIWSRKSNLTETVFLGSLSISLSLIVVTIIQVTRIN